MAVDTSVVVAGFASWHEGHPSAAAALARKPRVPAHVLVEAYSVLTRLPPPHRAPADLAARAHLDLVRMSARNGLAGGGIYDALIAATTRHAGATLLTRDQRARSVYDRMGVRYELVG